MHACESITECTSTSANENEKHDHDNDDDCGDDDDDNDDYYQCEIGRGRQSAAIKQCM